MKRVVSGQYSVGSEEGRGMQGPDRSPGAGEPGETESRPPSLAASLLFFVGLGAGCGAVVMGGVFAWPWLIRAAEWVGWVARVHPGIVMLVMLGVAVGALRLARLLDERGDGREQ